MTLESRRPQLQPVSGRSPFDPQGSVSAENAQGMGRWVGGVTRPEPDLPQ